MGFVQPRVVKAKRWAGELIVRDDWVVLDTETTGLGRRDQVIELAVVDSSGRVLFDRRMCPTVPVSEDAFRVHGIGLVALQGEKIFADFREMIDQTIARRRVMIYNRVFDCRMLRQTAEAFKVKPLDFVSEDVMVQYAEYVGDWNDVYQSFTFQKLPGAGHSALVDALATWWLIRKMGGYDGGGIS